MPADECPLCNKTPNLKYTLNCGDTYCFLCIKTYFLEGNEECPTCKTFISDEIETVRADELTDDLKINQHVFWLYESNYGNHSWCYDNVSTEQLEQIWLDYNRRKNIGKNNEIEITVSLPQTTTNQLPPPIPNNIQFVPMNVHHASTHNLVNFSDPIMQSVLTPSSPVSYIIKIGRAEYQIDMDQMRQINIKDTYKQRRIKRVELSTQYTYVEMLSHLKTQYNVLGIAGVKI